MQLSNEKHSGNTKNRCKYANLLRFIGNLHRIAYSFFTLWFSSFLRRFSKAIQLCTNFYEISQKIPPKLNRYAFDRIVLQCCEWRMEIANEQKPQIFLVIQFAECHLFISLVIFCFNLIWALFSVWGLFLLHIDFAHLCGLILANNK